MQASLASNNSLRIALVGPLPPPAGGMANQMLQLQDGLRKQGHQVEVVQVNAPYRPAWVESIQGVRALFRLLAYISTLWRTYGKVDVVHVLANSGWSWHLFAAPAICIARMRKRPVLLNYRGGLAEEFFQKQWRWVALSLNKCQKIIVPSAFLQRVFSGYDKDTGIVPNILDTQCFYPVTDKQSLNPGSEDKPFVIAVTRNLEAIYDIPTAIRAFDKVQKTYPNTELWVAGSGPEQETIIGLINELGLSDKVRMLGRLGLDEVAELYREVDLIINSSRVDNSPNSLIEALASGVPIVTTDVGGIPDVVTANETALMITSENPQAMAAAIIELIGNRELREKLVTNGLALAEKYHSHSVLALLEQHYRELLSAEEPHHA